MSAKNEKQDEAKTNDITKEEFESYITKRITQINKKLNEFLNEEQSEHYLKKVLERSGYTFDMDAIVKSVMEPANYLVNLGGKRVRPMLTLMVIEALGKEPNDYIEFSIIPEVIHEGTVIHDDVQDKSKFRRGDKALHEVYGADIALNVGDVFYFIAMPVLEASKKIDDATKHRIEKVYHKHMLGLGIGQGTDLAWHNFMVDPFKITEDNYFRVAFDKTGGLTSFAAKLGAIIAQADDAVVQAFGDYAATLGVAFQIQDDVLNIRESKLAENKGALGEDITEGKITLLVVHALHNSSKEKATRLIEILKMHTKDQTLIKEVISIFRDAGSIEHAEEMSESLIDQAWSKLDKHIPDTKAKHYLKMFTDKTLTRTV